MYAVVSKDSPNYGWVLSRHRTRAAAESKIAKAQARVRRKPGQSRSWLEWYVIELDAADLKKDRVRLSVKSNPRTRRAAPARKRNGRAAGADSHAVTELSLYIENEYKLVGAPNSQGQSIIKNLKAKARKGQYDRAKAAKLWQYLADTGAKMYAKEFATPSEWSSIFSVATRKEVAEHLRDAFEDQVLS